MTLLDDVRNTLAPNGSLRAAVNFGNAAVAWRDANGAPMGPAINLANGLSNALGVTCDLVHYAAAGKVMDGLDQGEWDIAFLAIDPVRERHLAFSAPYLCISACYMVCFDSPIQASKQVDAPGNRVAVGRGAAYDLHLTRTLQQAQIFRYPTASDAFKAFEDESLSAGAGVRDVVERYVAERPHLRALRDDFLVIDQAVCLPRKDPEATQACVQWINSFLNSSLCTN